jgi:hypothetical protein
MRGQRRQRQAGEIPTDADDARDDERIADDRAQNARTMTACKHGDRSNIDDWHEQAEQDADRCDAFGPAETRGRRERDVCVETEAALEACGERLMRQPEQRLRERRQQHSRNGERDTDDHEPAGVRR